LITTGLITGYIIVTVVYLFDTTILQRKNRKESGIGGFKRWDGIYEVHIGDVNSKRDFYNKLIKTIYICKTNNHCLEFIASNRSYGSLLKNFGEAIVQIKPVGLYGRIIVGNELYKSESQTVLTKTSFLNKVIIDPSKLKIEKLDRGNYILRR
jgi:hypothetical protein